MCAAGASLYTTATTTNCHFPCGENFPDHLERLAHFAQHRTKSEIPIWRHTINQSIMNCTKHTHTRERSQQAVRATTRKRKAENHQVEAKMRENRAQAEKNVCELNLTCTTRPSLCNSRTDGARASPLGRSESGAAPPRLKQGSSGQNTECTLCCVHIHKTHSTARRRRRRRNSRRDPTRIKALGRLYE